METRKFPDASLSWGVSLVLLGLIFLAATSGVAGLNWSNIWPAFVMLLGVEPITRAVLDREVSELRRGRLVAEGSLALMLGAYFFTITLGAFSWSQQATQWPLYLIMPGIAALIGYFASGFHRSGYFVVGLSLGLSGGGLLAGTLSGILRAPRWEWFDALVRWFGPEWETTWWPIFPIFTGMALLIASAFARSPGGRSGLALPGGITFLVGVFFLATTLGYLSWEDQGRLWPLYPLIVGVASLIAYFASDARYRFYLVPAVVLGSVGLVFLPMTLLSNNLIGQLWPLLLVVAGVVFLMPWTHGRGPRAMGSR